MKKWLVLLTLLITGCAVNTYKNTYSLNNVCVAQENCCGGVTSLTLSVSEVSASYGYDTDQMLYMECPYLIKAYSQNRWLVPPNQMLTPLVAQYIRNACFFHAVVTPPFSGCVDYRLDTRLLKLQQEFVCCPSRIRMILHAAIINNKTNCVVREQMFGAIVLAPENNPYGGVIAANKATQQILCELTRFVIDSVNCYVGRFGHASESWYLEKPKRTTQELYLPPPERSYRTKY